MDQGIVKSDTERKQFGSPDRSYFK